MEKPNSNSQSSLKGSGSSNGSDKGKDFSGLQSFKNRSGARRRESSQKIERKQAIAAPKQFYGEPKRPRTRGFGDRGRGTASGGLDLEWDSDLNQLGAGAAASDFGEKKSSKKHNLSHLLNFTFAPRDNAPGQEVGRHPGVKSNRHKYSKEQFIQANSQFIVRQGNDYAIHGSDPGTVWLL